MTNQVSTLLKYAQLQMAAESLFGISQSDPPGAVRDNTALTALSLKDGNNRSTKFTDVDAAEFVRLWEVVEHKSNTETGFSGTLFRAKSGGGTEVEALRTKYGITAGELTLSFRSTEFADDAARDNQATNAMEIRPFGYAFGQIADMQTWYQSLLSSGNLTTTTRLSVTGYSLGGHLAIAFNQMRREDGTLGRIDSTYTFNGAGVGEINQGNLTQVIQTFQGIRTQGATGLFATPEGKSLYEAFKSQLGAHPSIAQLDQAHTQIRGLISSLDAAQNVALASDYGKLHKAISRARDIAWEAYRVTTVTNPSNLPREVTVGNIDGVGLDYQLAVLEASKSTSAYRTDIADVVYDLANNRRAQSTGLGNMYDIFGETYPSAVANSQIHYGTQIGVAIEDQPLWRGNVGFNVALEAALYSDIKLLVDNFSTNDFGDTHSLVLIVDSLAVQSTLNSLDNSFTDGSYKSLFRGASTAKQITGAFGQGTAEGDVLENITNDLARLFGKSADLVGSTSGGTWNEITSRNALHNRLNEINTFIKTNNLAGKFTITPIVSLSSSEIRQDFASIIGLVSGARFGIKAKDVASRDLVNQALGGVYVSEYIAFNQDKELIAQGGELSNLNYTDTYLIDRSAYANRLIEAGIKNIVTASDGSITLRSPDAKDTDFIDLVNSKQINVRSDPLGVATLKIPQRVIFGNSQDNVIGGVAQDDRLYGGAGNDTITADKGDDYIEGGAGDDTLLDGGEGNDKILGGAGNDKLVGGTGNDILIGGTGNDEIIGGDDADTLVGGEGTDTLTAGGGNDILMGGTGDDTLDGGEGVDFLNGGAGKDTLTGGQGNDYLYDQGGADQTSLMGDAGNDILIIQSGSEPITLQGGSGNDVIDIQGTSAPNASIDAGLGNDLINGGSEADAITGGDGADNIAAGAGDDFIAGGQGADYLLGGEGNDNYIYTEANFGTDLIDDSSGSLITSEGQLFGGSFDINRLAYLGGGYEYRQYTMGNMTLLGINRLGDTKNTIYVKDWQYGQLGIYLDGQEQTPAKPRSSPITVESQAGNDVDFILGKDAADGGKGNDFLQGTDAQSVLSGGIGNDVINGMGGDDWLEGGDGNDYIGTGQGSDVAYGGKGNDVLTAYGTLSTDVCAREPVDLITTQRFFYKIAGSDARIEINHPRLSVFDFQIQQKPATDAGSDLVFRNVGSASPSLEAGTTLRLILGETEGIQRGESLALDKLPTDKFGQPIGYPFQLASNSALPATGGKGVRLWGGSGNDILYGAGDSDKLYGEADNDVLVGFGGDDELYGGAGKDELSGGDGRDFLDGGNDDSADTLYGGMGADVIHGGGGDDKIVGDLPYLKGANGYPPGTDTKLMGGDYLSGGAGKDKIWGDAGDDYLDGGTGDDKLYGGLDDDHLFGGENDDELSGGKGNDYLDGGAGKDNLYELDADGEGADILYGRAGDDALDGAKGDDILDGGDDNDVITGGDGNDILRGGDGIDTLYGDGGAGKAGDDILEGGLGNDKLNGGGGSDMYVFAMGDGQDTIQDDGSSGSRNTIVFKFASNEVHRVKRNGLDLVVSYGANGTNSVTVTGFYGGGFGLGYQPGGITTQVEVEPQASISAISFEDGEVWDEAKILSLAPAPTDSEVEPDPFEQANLPYFVNALLERESVKAANKHALTFTFAQTGDFSGFAIYTEEHKQAVRSALAKYSDVLDLSFTEVASTESADLRFFMDDLTSEDMGAFAGYASPGSGEIHLNSSLYAIEYVDEFGNSASKQSLSVGQSGFEVLLHEIGHALGLKHPFESPQLPYAENSNANTVMSYTRTQGPATELAMFDVAALQYLYGVAKDKQLGDNSYTLDQRYISDASGIDTLDASAQMQDVFVNLKAGGWSHVGEKNASILAAGQSFIGFGTLIENAIGGSGNDTLEGNDLSNTLLGGLGHDVLFGGLGDDVLQGGEGADRYAFNLGDGKDVITDGDSTSTLDISGVSMADIHYGRGVLLYGSQGDSVHVDIQSINSLVLGDRTYTKTELQSIFGAASADADVVLSYQQSQGQLLGAGDWNITGNRFGNALLGNAGNNTLEGGAGDDVLAGGEGADIYVFKQGDGSDVIQDLAGNSTIVLVDVDANTVYHDGVNLYYGNGLDQVRVNAQEISELVINGVSYNASQIQALFGATSLQTSDSGDLALRRYINNGELLGSGDWKLTGNDRDNALTGNSGNNNIEGGGGADTLLGGAGDDTYTVAQAGDVIVENLNDGNDTVIASVDYSLSANVENLALTGSAQNATGNELSNAITGNAQNNHLDGGLGDDQLTGGLGDDQLTGGIGSDVYIYRPGDGNDEIIDVNADSQQTDELRLTGGILASQVSLLRLNQDVLLSVNGSNSILLRNQGMGSGQGIERITFDSGEQWDAAQILDRATAIDSVERFQIGTNGADTLQGFAGSDVLLGRAGNDVLIGDSGNDQLMGGAGSDELFGGDGNDKLIDSDGLGLMDGGSGDDTYAIDTSQTATEINIRDLSGTDQLVLNWARDHILVDAQTLTLTHRITGQIVKLPGLDQQQGGTGQQDACAIETITVLEGDGTSLQQVTLSWHQMFLGAEAVVLGNAQDNQIALESSTISTALLGMTGDDVLTGGSGVEIFRPGSGNDRMEGGAGDDRYDVSDSSGNKIILDTQGNDTLVLAWNAEDLGFDLQTSSFFNKSTGQRVTLEGFDLMQDPPACPIERIQLANGEAISAAEYFTRMFQADARAVDGSLIGTALSEEFISSGQGERIFSAGGNDRLNGSDDDDYLDGGTGADLMKGGGGSDTYVVDDIGDQVIDAAPTWSSSFGSFSNNLNEIDLVISSVSFKLGEGLDNILLTGNEAINATGNWLSNTLTGNSADNILIGSALSLSFKSFGNISNFYKDGYSYTGTMYQIPGTSTSSGGINFELETSIELRRFIATNRNYFLNGIYDYWGASNNVAGYFSLLNDPNINYVVSPNGQLGIDRYELPNLRLPGDTLYGGDGNDKLYGDIDDDLLDGGEGNDLLVAGGGSDVMIGGAGDDVYVLSNNRLDVQTDVVLTELTNGGSDTVVTDGDWTLADNFENLVLGYNPSTYDPYFNILYEQLGGGYPDLSLSGSEGLYRSFNSYRTASTGKGNSLDNKITVNTSASATVYGYAGNDNIDNPWGASYGGDGDDHIDGSFAYGEAGNDTLRGQNLDGGLGADLMIGWDGIDNTYFVDNAEDVVVESEDEGIDTLHTALDTPALQAHIENLVLIEGSTATIGVGNELNNHISGNSSDNVLDGGDGGDDTILGGAGNDTLTAGRGDDLLDGGSGADTMQGGRGSDTYVVDNVMDQIVDDASDAGVDTVKSDVSWTLTDGVENLLLGGQNSIDGTGNATDNYISGNEADNVLTGLAGNDIILGLTGNDVLDGGDGNDRLNGGAGDDTMIGGQGDDSFIVDSYSDVIIEEANAGQDHIDVYSAYVMSENIEDVTLYSDYLVANSSANRITASAGGYNYIEGRGGDDVIYGGDDALTSDYYGGTVLAYNDDRLFGDEGDDTLDGGSGSDYLMGGDGNDDLFGGEDRVRLNTLAFVPPTQEYLDNNGGPATLEELIVYLGVLPNDDYLDGGAGIDRMRGGTGNDTYIADGNFILNEEGRDASINLCDEEHRFGMDRASRGAWVADQIVELEDQGYDTVYTTASIDLSAQHVEQVLLEAIHSEGDLRNDLSVVTGIGSQVLIGNFGNNRLDGGLDADYMAGGQGNDTYVVDDANDQVVEYQDSGFDTVRTVLNNYTLAADLEGLVLEGGADLTGYGNDADNVLIGNSGANILQGGLGNDTLAGWRGNDVLKGGEGSDTYAFSRGDGVDRIVDNQGSNRLHLSGDITLADLRMRLNGNDLVITLVDGQGLLSTDSVVLENWAQTNFVVGETRIDQITFCGGAITLLNESMLNQAPTAVADFAAVSEDDTVIAAGNVLTNDSDVDTGDSLSVANPGRYQGNYGQLTVQADGSYSYSLNNNASAVQSLKAGEQVADVFAITTTDGSASAAANLTITVTGSNDGPVTSADVAAVSEDGIVMATGNVLSNDSDVDSGDTLSVANPGSYQGNYGQLTVQADGSYTYSLNNNASAVQSLKAGEQVADVFSITTTDGTASAAANLTITVTGSNDGPVTSADVAAASEDGIVMATGNVLSNDSDDDSGDTLSVANPGSYQGNYGQLTVQADGSYSYSLNNNASAVQSLQAGEQVADVFSITTTDGKASAVANLTITVTGSNDGPIASADVAAVSEDGIVTATGNVLNNDSDVDTGDALTVANAGSFVGQYGTLELQADGGYTYSLNSSSVAVQGLRNGQQVADVFVITTSDGEATVSSSLSVTISGSNDGPIVQADVAMLAEDGPVTATGNVLNNDRDVDVGDLLRVANPGQYFGQYGTLQLLADGQYTYTLNNEALAVQSLAVGQNISEVFVTQTTDGEATESSLLTITITGSNDAPIVQADLGAVFEDGVSTASGNVLSNDGDVDADAVLAVANAGTYQGIYGDLVLQANGSYSYSLNNNASAVQSLQAEEQVADVFSITTTDGTASAAANLTITVTGSNDGPVASADEAAASEDGVLTATGNVLTNDRDVDAGDTLTVANAGTYLGSFGQLVLQSDGFYTYTLSNNSAAVQSLRAGQQAADVFAVSASDGTAATSSNLTISIAGNNDAPIVQADFANASEDTAVTVVGNALTNDRDIDVGDALSVANAGTYQGVYGQLVLRVDGSYTYNLNNNASAVQSLRAGQQVQDQFTVVTTDAIASASAALTITVTGTNDAPVARGDVAAVSEDGVLTAVGNVLSNDSDVDAGSTLSIVSAGTVQGTYGSLVLHSDGSYTYTLNNASSAVQSLAVGQQVQDSFSYSATDGIATSNAQLVLTITGSNDAPTLTSALADSQVAAGQAFSIDLPDNSFADIDRGDVLQYSASLANGSPLPAWLSFNNNGLVFTGNAAATLGGQSFELRVTATDRSGASVSDVFNLSVSGTGCVGLTLIGTSGKDRLVGSACDDTIDGKQGADTMIGGNGNDVYYVDAYCEDEDRSKGNEGLGNGEDPPPPGHDDNYNDGPGTSPGNPGRGKGYGDDDDDDDDDDHGDEDDDDEDSDDCDSCQSDLVLEYLNQGYDRVIATVSYVLPEHVEALTLAGSACIDGRGNSLDNWLSGNSASNSLDGQAGNDLVSAGAGDDAVYGASGNDILEGQEGHDQMEGGDGRDALFGGAGNDTLKSNSGRGLLAGGRGDDALYVGSEATVVAFNKGDGQDTLYLNGSSPVVLSLGGGLRYEDIRIRRQGSDLYFDFNGSKSEFIKVSGYYAMSASSRPNFTMQVLTQASGTYNPSSWDRLRDNMVETFDATKLIKAFDSAYAGSSSLRKGNAWAVMNRLLDAHLAGSNTAALGGDLAYQFGSASSANLAGMSMASAGAVLSDAGFATGMQTLQRPAAVGAGPRLVG